MSVEAYSALSALGGAVVSFLIGWGMIRSKVAELDRRITRVEDESSKQYDQIHSLHDVYVSYQHFNEIMQTIKESQRDMNQKMEKVLELLTERS